ncbi:MAG: glycosyltransferase family 39 protein [Kiritimatiellae bacterium]|nr:glycosyltransferase family 39 protein [Kiritimatiellia bacterium]
MKFVFPIISRRKALIFLNAVYLAAGLAWIILIPYNNAPDENTHFHYSVEFILQHHRLPVWGVDDIERFRHALSSYNQLPALNYVLYAIGAETGRKLFGLEPYLGARLVSLLWGLVFLNFLFLAARELCAGEKNALIAAAAFVLIPQVFFSFCYVNGDAHSLAIAAVFTFALARFFRRPDTTGIIFAGAAIGLLFSAKYNYYIYFPCLAVLLAWTAWRGAVSPKTIVRLAISAVVLSLLISGFWFIRNYFLYNSPLPLFLSEEISSGAALAREVHPVNRGLSIASLGWLVKQGFIRSTFDSFFAVFGYLNVGFRRWVYLILELAVPALAALFAIDLLRKKDRGAIRALIALCLMAGAVIGMHVWACLTFDYQAQGRYNFTLIAPATLFAAWATTRVPSLKKYVFIFLIMTAGLFIGANVLIARTYAPPVRFFISQTDRTGGAERTEKVATSAKRVEKNYYATPALAWNKAGGGIRIEFSKKFLARYRDLKIELETDNGLEIISDWNAAPPREITGLIYDGRLNAFETRGGNAGFSLFLRATDAAVRSIKITCRIENRRLYDPDL